MEEREGGSSDPGAAGSTVVGGVVGFGGAVLAAKGLLFASGVGGLSAAGITSGLAVMGGTMLGGIVVFAALPVAGTAVGAWGGYKAYKWWRDRGPGGQPRLPQ